MTISPAVLIGPSAVPNSAGALYTVPANTTVVITRASVVNVTNAGATLKLWLVRSGDSRSDTNIVYGATAAGQAVSAGPSSPVVIDALAGAVLSAGDAIHGLSDTADALNIVASGWTQ